jgi:EAL and modified HD-GYP domain-containing signal transduction protein
MQDSPLFGQIHLGYTPIVGRGGHVGGLQLTLMPSRTETRLDAAGLLGLLCEAFAQGDGPASAAPVSVLLNIVSESTLEDLMGLQPPSQFGLELPAFMTSDTDRVARFRDLRAQDVSLVAKGWAVSSLPERVLQSFRALIADAADEDLGVDRPPSQGPRALDTYIQGVRTHAEVELAFASGALGVLGLPEDDELLLMRRGGLAPELRGVIELMHLADRKGPYEQMERLLQSDAALASSFLRLLNSPAFGVRVALPTFAHAFLLLGHGRLLRWLALLLVWSVPGAAARPLARVAVRRGLALAELARTAGQEDLRDEMFICGVMSLLDRMTGLSFDELASLVPMPPRVQASLQRADGPFAQHLSLMSAVEHASFAEMDEVADTLLIGQGDLNRAVLSALAAARWLED